MCERNTNWLPLLHTPNGGKGGNLAGNPGMCPDQESNQRTLVRRLALNPVSHASQGCFSFFYSLFITHQGSGTGHYSCCPSFGGERYLGLSLAALAPQGNGCPHRPW